MCGRYAFSRIDQALIDRLALDEEPPPLKKRWNLAPAQPVPVVRRDPDSGARALALLRWGLVPRWAKEEGPAGKTINARSETVADKPSFREAFARRRCLLPADGWYEWRALGKGRSQPWFLEPAASPVCFAGVWERWRPPDRPEAPLESCAILTCAATGEAAQVHERMPLVLPEAAWARWLEGTPLTPDERARRLAPWDTDGLRLWAVDERVGSVAVDDPGLLEPAGQGELF